MLKTPVTLCTPPAAVAERAFVAEITVACAVAAVLLMATVVDATALCANWFVLLKTPVTLCTPAAVVVESAFVAEITLPFKTVAPVVTTAVEAFCRRCSDPQPRTKRKMRRPINKMRTP